nr:reverse transcriptase domain-containing protein [Tanacetum cinerariifolium]
MKLNPKKCSFGLAEGVFFGYVITPEGIKPCTDKIAAIMQLPSPQTVKEVQSLNGKLASLNRFLSKSAKKSLPLFQTLKKCIKKSDFRWTAEAEQAFQQLKQHLSDLPILVAPRPQEELIMYLSATHGAISVMSRPDVAGRLQKWSIMLGEHNITYRPRTSIKGQILADFLNEMPGNASQGVSVVMTQEEPWTLFTDGSSCVDGSGVGLILTNPEGVEFTYALRFQFAASNNEAEYEALVAGLRIATQLGVKNVQVNVDSKLVANQVLGTYVAKEDNMINMKGAPECMRIFGFMHGINNPELTKRLNERVPKTMEEMMMAITAFIRGEAAAASKKKGHVTPKEILASEANKFLPPPPMVTPVEKRNSNKFCDFHNDKGHNTDECMQLKKQIEELVRAGKLSHLIKEIKQGREQPKIGRKEAAAKDKPTTIYMVRSWQRTVKQKVTQSFEPGKEIAFPPLTTSSGTEGPLVIKAEIGGHVIHRMYIDGGSSMEILYEHCFNRLRPEIKSQMVPATTSMTGFSGETTWPLGQLRLLVTIGDATHSTKTWMNFMVVKSLSPYNGIIGRSGLKAIQAVPSTVHGMLKFPTEGGIVTICSSLLIPAECASIGTSSGTPREERTCPTNFTVALHPNFPDQEVVVGGSLFDRGRTELCALLKKNLDISAWQPFDMTGVSRSVAEHRLNIREGCPPMRQKKRGQAPERAKAIQTEVQKLVGARIMREVYYHDWLSNPVMVKKHDGSWRMCVDFTDLYKACPQDCYPLPEIE